MQGNGLIDRCLPIRTALRGVEQKQLNKLGLHLDRRDGLNQKMIHVK
jgi:hypothetical protein